MDKGPHLIHFRTIQINFFRRYYVNFLYWMLLDICLVYLPGPAFRFFKMAVTESFAIPSIRPVARVPVQSMANLRTCSLIFGSHALLLYSSTKLRWRHSAFLQRYRCFPALLCPFRITCSLPQCGHLMLTVLVTIFSSCFLYALMVITLCSLFYRFFYPVSTAL